MKDLAWSNLLPSLAIEVQTWEDIQGGLPRPNGADVRIYKPVATSCLFGTLLRTPMRQSVKAGAPMACSGLVSSFVLHEGGYLYASERQYDEGKHAWKPNLKRQPLVAAISLNLRLPCDWSSISSSFRSEVIPAKHVVDSLFELLKIATWSDKLLILRDNGVKYDYVYGGCFEPPIIMLNLRKGHLPDIVDRVSEDTCSRDIPNTLSFSPCD